MNNPTHHRPSRHAVVALCGLAVLALLAACARMGQPDGGWYDETPPRIVSTSPADKSVNIHAKKVYINFDEYIKIDNATENVIVSPPQIEAPEIKSQGKRIVVALKDSLKPNITYTIDFSDAITDNNEGNPLGNYTYSFSTGSAIDTMEIAGHVLDAQNLEPIKGILVGLYANLEDSAFRTQPMLRVARTDDTGRFVIKGVAAGKYRIYALQDADGNFIYNQKSEKMAFSHDIIVPTFKDDIRQDTVWRDSLHIDSIIPVKYTHFLPDDIVLRAFTTTLTDRYLVKTDRSAANHFTLYFSYGNPQLPVIKGLNFDERQALLVEPNAKRDTINYWLRDTALVNQDTLRLQVQYLQTDTTGTLQLQTDTLELLSKQPYAKRMKDKQKKIDEWKKAQDKAKRKGKPYEEQMPAETLPVNLGSLSQIDPDQNIRLQFDTPLQRIDTALIHLYSKIDTTWYQSRFRLREVPDQPRTYEIVGEWRPEVEYSLEMDSLAFCDIYGMPSGAVKVGFKVHSLDDYSSLFMTLTGMEGHPVICQLLNSQDEVVRQVRTSTGSAEFFYVMPDKYYMRLIVDDNDNGEWDTGDYDANRQPEMVYYYPGQIECRAKWDVTQTWNPTQQRLDNQKPAQLVKQRSERRRNLKGRNAQRAKNMGITYPDNINP